MIDLQIKDKKGCTGCYACLTICPKNCISMETDNEGFWYPKVDHDKCIECKRCIKVCPTISRIIVENKPRAYACYNIDDAIRLNSSSGGIFSIVAYEIIHNGGVVFGAGFNEHFEVVHSHIEKAEELSKFRGSKYVQSKIRETYSQVKDFLDERRQVLFTGTPCQVSGLKSYLGRPYDNLFCMDNICHGVPSPKVWKEYISYREGETGSETQRIAFRRKDEGWKRYSVSFLFKNNTEYRETLEKDLYMRAFLKDICLRPSCYDCKFKTLHRESDITLADFWGIQYIVPEMDDDKGTSLIFINSHKGDDMIEKIREKIVCKEVNINQAVIYNSAAIKSVGYNPKRDSFFRELEKRSFDDLVKKYCADKISVKIKRNIKSLSKAILSSVGLLSVAKNIRERAR